MTKQQNTDSHHLNEYISAVMHRVTSRIKLTIIQFLLLLLRCIQTTHRKQKLQRKTKQQQK